MSLDSKENESYSELYDKIIRVVGFMEKRDGKKPSFEGCVIEMIKTKELSAINLEFNIPRYAEVWQDIVGYVDYKPLLDLVKEKNAKKKIPKKRKSVYKQVKDTMEKQRFLPTIDKNKTKTLLLLIGLFILICFYYEWITNVPNHVDLFFGVNDDSFLGVLAVAFWGVTCISTGLFFGYQILKLLFVNGDHKEQNLVDNVMAVISNNKIMFGLFIVFFILFSSSSKYYNNYIGLKLQNIVEDEYTISGEEFLEYNESGHDVPDEIVYEILDEFDNNLFKKEKEIFINNRLDVFGEYYDYIGFNSEKFIFKDTGAFQGYSTYLLKEGFFPYLKCLFFSLFETSYRAIIFFSIAGIIVFPLLLLASKCSDEQLRRLMGYGVSILFIILALYLIYAFGKSFFEWVKSFFN